jgi:hypothetical protein
VRIQRLSRFALAVAAAVLCLPATPAWAHATLLSTSPGDGALVTGPVTEVTLKFNEMVRQRSTTVTVTGADGTSYSNGAARVVDHDVIQAVKPLPAGVYRVAWHTVSADGDPEGNQFSFKIAEPPAPTTAAAEPSTTTAHADPTSAPPPATGAAGKSSGLGWLWVPVAAVLLAALVAAGLLYRRRRSAPS